MSVTVIKLIASAALVAAVIWWVDGAEVIAHLSGLSFGWIILSMLSLVLATASMARRWQLVADHLGLRLTYGTALREYYLGTFINQVLPGGVTGDIARAFRARRDVDLKTAALSVALERLLGQIAIFSILGLGLAMALLIPGGVVWGPLAWVFLAGLVTFASLGVVLSRRGGVAGRAVAAIAALQKRPELLVHAVLASACVIISFFASARATGTTIPPEGWATVIPLILIAMLVPLSVGGWGWREGAAAALFPLFGATSGAGVAAGVAYGGAILVSSLPAAMIMLAHGSAKPFPTPTKQG